DRRGLGRVGQGRREHHLGPVVLLLAVERQDLVAHAERGRHGVAVHDARHLRRRRHRRHAPDDRRRHLVPVHEQPHEQQGGQDDVHDHAGRDHQHAGADRLLRVRPRVVADRVGVHVVLAEHLHVPAEREPIEPVLGLAELEVLRALVELPAAERLVVVDRDAVLGGEVLPDAALVLGAGGADARADPLAPREDRLPEADRELLDADADVLGREEVPQLVPEDDEAEAERQQGDVQDV
ncbi:MAG: hypothetical protein AVDCRST_MAG64-2737, partial [uncultured Phycisphaerae bacterium]